MKAYTSKSLANKLFLKKDLLLLKMEVEGDIQDHLNTFNGLIAQLKSLEESFSDENLAILLLYSLPNKYNSIVTSMLFGKKSLSLDDTVLVLLEAKKLSGQGGFTSGSNSSSALYAGTRSKGMGKKKYNSNVKFFYCNKVGHTRKNCLDYKERHDRNDTADVVVDDIGYEWDILMEFEKDA